MLAGRAKILGGLVDVNKGGRGRVHVESVQARQQGRMVIAWDRQSGVSRSIPRWLSLYARSDPARTERSSFRGGYAILEGGVPAMSGGGTAEVFIWRHLGRTARIGCAAATSTPALEPSTRGRA